MIHLNTSNYWCIVITFNLSFSSLMNTPCTWEELLPDQALVPITGSVTPPAVSTSLVSLRIRLQKPVDWALDSDRSSDFANYLHSLCPITDPPSTPRNTWRPVNIHINIILHCNIYFLHFKRFLKHYFCLNFSWQHRPIRQDKIQRSMQHFKHRHQDIS